MKKLKYLIAFTIIASATIITSCVSDDPNEPNTPTTDEREKFHGSWSCSESNMTYTVNIVADTNSKTQMKLYNFHNLGFEEKVMGIVSENTLSIPSQNVCQNTINIYGSSTIRNNNNYIDFYYIYNDGVNCDTIQALFTRQS